MASQARYLEWSVLTVGIGNNCQKRPISEKPVDEEQGVLKSDQHFTDQTWIPQQAGGRTESGGQV